MQPFRRLTAIAVAMDQPNIDTDQIIPARFLWRARAAGYGELLFHDLRYAPDGTPAPGFILNQQPEAQILIAEHNFGCGSSREQAVWALFDAGFRAVIAPSFGDIFYNNCCKQGVLPVTLPAPDCAALRAACPGPVTVDLETQTVAAPGGFHARFPIAAYQRHQLLEGLDDVAATLVHIAAITAFEAAYDRALPWLQ